VRSADDINIICPAPSISSRSVPGTFVRKLRASAADVEAMLGDPQRRGGLLARDLVGGSRKRRLVDVGKREMAPAARQCERDPAADAAGRARHHRRAACKLEHVSSSFIRKTSFH